MCVILNSSETKGLIEQLKYDGFTDKEARYAVGVTGISMEDHGEVLPPPSCISEIDVSNSTFSSEGNSFLSMIDVDFSEYRRKIDMKTVRRNVALPSWLNYEADKAGINVSRVLQEALMNVLNVSPDGKITHK